MSAIHYWLLPNRKSLPYDQIFCNGVYRSWKENDPDLPFSELPPGWISRIPSTEIKSRFIGGKLEHLYLQFFKNFGSDNIFLSLSSPLGHDDNGRNVSITYIYRGPISKFHCSKIFWEDLPDIESSLLSESIFNQLVMSDSDVSLWILKKVKKYNSDSVSGKLFASIFRGKGSSIVL